MPAMRTALAALLLVASLPAFAGQCADFAGGSAALQAADSAARLTFIRERLKREAPRARLYTGLWGGAYSLITLGELALVPVTAPAEHVDNYAGAIASLVTVGMLIAMPLEVMDDADAFDGRVANQAASGGPCAGLAEAERLFLRDAEGEAFGVSLLMHGTNVALNAVLALVLGLGYGHWGAGALNAVVGAVLGEATIFTQPTQLVTDLERYREGNLAPSAAAAMRFGAGASFALGTVGVQLGATF
jgi:hypothetical protein